MMGTKAIKILKLDVQKILEELNHAFADEWLAYYQYWIGAQVARGPMRISIIEELMEHANEELEHAKLISDRIIQLGGTPILEPKNWYQQTNCGYVAPDDFSIKIILQQNIKAEQCAIDQYSKLIDLTKDKDEVTFNMMYRILEDEVEHEEDLQSLLEDIDLIK